MRKSQNLFFNSFTVRLFVISIILSLFLLRASYLQEITETKKKQERDLFNNFIYRRRRTAMPAAASFISLLLIPTNYYKTILSFHSTLKFWKCLNDETGP